MKVSLPTGTFDLSRKALWEQLQTTYQWYLKTPERALEQAHQAVLNIQAIERQSFDSNAIDLTSTQYPANVMVCLQTDFEHYLNIVKLQISEFKLSRVVLSRTDHA